PEYLAPTAQEFFAWPKWGQYYQTHGMAGEPIDMGPAIELMRLYKDWEHSTDEAERDRIWREMLAIHADQQFGIGILSEAPQPVVVSHRLKNVPEYGKWAWDPGAHFGVHRIDEFFFSDDEVVAQVRQ
ncbi:MAG: ABC transporter substrate-binding protein, partial [Pseudomonadota bacterium]